MVIGRVSPEKGVVDKSLLCENQVLHAIKARPHTFVAMQLYNPLKWDTKVGRPCGRKRVISPLSKTKLQRRLGVSIFRGAEDFVQRFKAWLSCVYLSFHSFQLTQGHGRQWFLFVSGRYNMVARRHGQILRHVDTCKEKATWHAPNQPRASQIQHSSETLCKINFLGWNISKLVAGELVWNHQLQNRSLVVLVRIGVGLWVRFCPGTKACTCCFWRIIQVILTGRKNRDVDPYWGPVIKIPKQKKKGWI